MKRALYFILLVSSVSAFSQGYNHNWLLGNNPFSGFPNGRALIDSSGISISTEFRMMSFKGTQATYSDANGNFLMSSNGIWIANANNDTMLNGAGLNPGAFASSWPYGQVITYGNIFIPFPDDSSKVILVHQTGDSSNIVPSLALYYSVVDLNLDSGRGAVIIKNQVLIQDSIGWGIAACKHGNGRDWWIVVTKDSSDLIYKLLITPNGLSNVTTQHLNFIPVSWGNSVQLTFSQNGEKFVLATYDNPTDRNSSIVLLDFNRCTGMFSNTHIIPLTNGSYLWGLAFSVSGNYLYASKSTQLFQINTINYTVDTVAHYDGFISPGPNCCATSFYYLYLGANSKIYSTSGSSTRHLHVINYPDSTGVACDVQQHAIDLVDYLHLRAVPNHPNYYLGSLQGSPCDTLQWTGIEELQHDFRFRIYPNPVTNSSLHIGYILPQNKMGTFQIYDITGKIVFKYSLPQWSNEQQLTLPKLANGIYSATIISNYKRVSKTIAIMNE